MRCVFCGKPQVGQIAQAVVCKEHWDYYRDHDDLKKQIKILEGALVQADLTISEDLRVKELERQIEILKSENKSYKNFFGDNPIFEIEFRRYQSTN